MNDYFARFSAAPAVFKKSFGMLAVAWVCHPIFIYAFFLANQAMDQAGSIIMRMAVISMCLCFLMFLIKKWARALLVLGNCFIVVYDLFVLAVSPPNRVLTVLCVMVVLSALVGTFWLFAKDSRDYYTQVNPKAASPNPLDPRDPVDR
jgi:hypothetical protein